MEREGRTPSNWAAVSGRWEFEKDVVTYLGPADQNNPFPHGVALCDMRLRSGTIAATVRFREGAKGSTGEIAFGYDTGTQEYYAAGLGGFGYGYDITEFRPNHGWRAIGRVGTSHNTVDNRDYGIEVRTLGQEVRLLVDGIGVLAHNLPRPLMGDQVGYYAWGTGPVEFRSMLVDAARPKAFVVMQFGEPFDAIYTDVIKPVAKDLGFDAYRADDVYVAGIVLQDIIRGIIEAEIIVAEITPPNPNVFYELGYAHALGKTVILLAERGNEMPFDIKSYRCIFYDNTIQGKKGIEADLRKHLENIVEGR